MRSKRQAGLDIANFQFRVISDYFVVMPDASQPSTSYTVIRMLRMQGFPPRFPGSSVILCSNSLSEFSIWIFLVPCVMLNLTQRTDVFVCQHSRQENIIKTNSYAI
jgi:hypothetical protein